MAKLLFICSGGTQRSPTFTRWINKNTEHEAKYMGLWNGPDYNLFKWADKVFVMELIHYKWFDTFRPELLPKIEIIGIGDIYNPDEPELIELIEYWYKKWTQNK